MSDHGGVAASPECRVARLRPLLEQDPGNLSLIADVAEAALDEHKPDLAIEMLDRYASVAPLPPNLINLAGLAALGMKQFDRAAACFGSLVEAGERDVAVLFNLAWCLAMKQEFGRALELIDDDLARRLPQAAKLQVDILHEIGEFDRAAERAREYVEIHADYGPLLAAVSLLALDIEDEELALRCASAAPHHPEAMTTLGTLALGQERAEEARELFDNALGRSAELPRAWVGRGLAELLLGRSSEAAQDIDRGAEMFGDHLGSWIAAGWSHLLKHDPATARSRFERALEVDPNFAESHGSLAVVDLLEGKTDDARKRTDTALRLDRGSFAAALAKVLMMTAAGDAAGARRIFELAVHRPVGGSGRSIAQALARIGLS